MAWRSELPWTLKIGQTMRNAKTIPKTAMLCFVMSGVLLICFISFIYVPRHLSIHKTRQTIDKLSDEINLSKKISPLHQITQQLNVNPFQPGLPVPDKTKLDRSDLTDAFSRLDQVAFKNRLRLVDKKMDMEFFDQTSDLATIDLKLGGKLIDFRSFLISVVSFPYFDTFNKIQIHADQHGSHYFTVQLNIRVGGSHE